MKRWRLTASRKIFALAALGLIGAGLAGAYYDPPKTAADGRNSVPREPSLLSSTDVRSVSSLVAASGADQQVGASRQGALPDISISSLNETRERPIFSPSRRPPAISVPKALSPEVPAGTNGPAANLVGAIAGKDVGIAIMLDPTSNTVFRLRVGESHAGWTLILVKKREVTFQKGSDMATLSIESAANK